MLLLIILFFEAFRRYKPPSWLSRIVLFLTMVFLVSEFSDPNNSGFDSISIPYPLLFSIKLFFNLHLSPKIVIPACGPPSSDIHPSEFTILKHGWLGSLGVC